LLFSRYSSTMSVMASPPSGDRVAALVNAYLRGGVERRQVELKGVEGGD
jgi:hypothetical protein